MMASIYHGKLPTKYAAAFHSTSPLFDAVAAFFGDKV